MIECTKDGFSVVGIVQNHEPLTIRLVTQPVFHNTYYVLLVVMGAKER